MNGGDIMSCVFIFYVNEMMVAMVTESSFTKLNKI
jgi:hypothetical protein